MRINFLKRRSLLSMSIALISPLIAHAQSDEVWPSKPITIVVASAPGSGVDLVARSMAQKLSAVFKQPVLVDNKPGGSGVLAGMTVARAKPDGYTLLYTNASFMAVAPAVIRNMSYDPFKDLAPIAQTAAGGIILLVNKDVPANNLKELISLVKANPERYEYGTWGNGSSGHLTTEWLKKQAGIKMIHAPYKSTPQVVNDLVSGVIPIGWSDPGTPVAMLESKKIKGIAISGNSRAPRTQGIPTMAEQGYPFDSVGWFGVFGPANLPRKIIDRLNIEINKIQKSPEMMKRMEDLNLEPPPVKTPEEFRSLHDTHLFQPRCGRVPLLTNLG